MMPRGRPRRVFLAAIALAVSVAACRESSPSDAAKRLELDGTVVAVDRARARVTVAHEEIEGYMDAMVMPFTVGDEWAVPVLEKGDRIAAILVVDGDRSWLEQIVISKGAGAASGAAAAARGEPPPGEEVPDFALVNQDGQPIRLRQYRGRALLLTFIYTRCPLPEFCPLMVRNFAELERHLALDPGVYRRTHLLAISFDARHDSPPVLRRYGLQHLPGRDPAGFGHWEFAAGSEEQVKAVANFFGVQYWPETNELVHSLRTALISPDGKLVKTFPGNVWKPQAVLRELRAALEASTKS